MIRLQTPPAFPFLRAAALTALLWATAGVPREATASDGEGPEYRDRQVAVRLLAGSDIAAFNGRWGTTLVASLADENYHLVEVPELEDCEQLALLMAADPEVLRSDLNFVVEGPEAVRQMVVGAVGGGWADFEFQRMAEAIGVATAHAYSRGEGITVAVLDTGVYEDHDVLHDRLTWPGRDFLDGDNEPRDEANGVDDDLDGMIDEGYGHGTMVAGLIALVAPEARILPIRILDDEGRTDLFTMAAGIEYARLAGARVINMSFGARLETLPGLEYLFQRCAAEGVIPVAGAGNDNRSDLPLYPAQVAEVFMVTALDTLGVKADFADYSERVLVAAPGVGLRSSYPEGEDDEEWGLGAGCSFATALVSAEVALILAQDPSLDHGAVRARVASAVTDIYSLPGNEAYLGRLGTGMIFLPLALGADQTAVPGIPELAGLHLDAYPNPTPGTVRFSLPGGRSAAIGPLAVFDSAGRLVRRLDLGATGIGIWDGLDEAGRRLPAGAYFARLSTPAGVLRSKVVLMR